MVDVEVRENGSINHPWYLHIRVDGTLVYSKSYMSKRLAEKAVDKAMMESLTEYVRLVRNMANFVHDTGIENYNTKPRAFPGTGHADD